MHKDKVRGNDGRSGKQANTKETDEHVKIKYLHALKLL